MLPDKISRDKMLPVLYRRQNVARQNVARQNVAYGGMSPMFGDDFFVKLES
jgi:hypothetical protein